MLIAPFTNTIRAESCRFWGKNVSYVVLPSTNSLNDDIYKRIPQSFNFYFTGRHFLGQSCGARAYQPLSTMPRFILYIIF
jgi:hypothetical protein